ncbi:hypothetical protein KY311_00945 [Candidatus Woesearchaeota archaeon]|nr:hypothetical protein [Candidatus Woesearchaeota archaeon]
MPEIAIDSKNLPEKKFKAGPIAVAVWRNKGEKGTYYSVSFEKRYKTDKEEWRSTKTLNMNDLPKAIVALQKAYEYLILKKTGKEIIEEEVDGGEL